MPTVLVNGIELYYERTGDGTPLVFSHELAGSYRSWEPQVRFFGRRYQVVTYNHRGYAPSTAPSEPEDYSQAALIEDLYQLIRHLGIAPAHVCGLSMGANVALNLGIAHPEVCRSLVIAACGTGTTNREQFERDFGALADRLEAEGMGAAAREYALSPARATFLRKDPRGWQGFYDEFLSHSALATARTLRGVLLRRPTVFQLAERLKTLRVPVLVVVGDEDEPCIEPALFMKRHLPDAGLAMFPQTGHTLNLEEPELFNRTVLDFLTRCTS